MREVRCAKCGMTSWQTGRFCQHCGSDLGLPATQNISPLPPPDNPGGVKASTQTEAEKAKNIRDNVIVITIVLACFFIGGFYVIDSLDSLRTSTRSGKRIITIEDFDQIKKDMFYDQVVEILGPPTERGAEVKITDNYSHVDYRWINPDGSMVMITFSRFSNMGDYNMLLKTVSNVGLRRHKVNP